MAARTDLVARSDHAIDSVRPFKQRRRGSSGGELLVSLAEMLVVGGDHLSYLDERRADQATAALRSTAEVPAPTTAGQLLRRFSKRQCEAAVAAMAQLGNQMDRQLCRCHQQASRWTWRRWTAHVDPWPQPCRLSAWRPGRSTGRLTGVEQAGLLVVTDLDGTLWDGAGCLYPGAGQAIERLAAMGATLLAATARRPAAARVTMEANRILLPAVLFDGSLGRDFASGETFHLHAFETDTALQVLERLGWCGLEPCVNVVHPERDVLVGGRPSTHPRHLDFLAPWTRRADLRSALEAETVLSFTIVGQGTDLLLPALAAVRPVAEASMSDDLRYGGRTLSVRPPGVSKWNGVLAFCAAHGLDPDRTLAIGDGENDVEMLARAAVSCSFAGSSPGALSSAGHVLPAAETGGWAAVLELAAASAG